jgi:hypothetical protein
MRNESMKVVPIRKDTTVAETDQELVDFAYNLWLARGFRGGSPEEDLLNAVRELRGRTSARPFLVRKRNDPHSSPVRRGVIQEVGHDADVAFAGR